LSANSDEALVVVNYFLTVDAFLDFLFFVS